VGSLKVVLKMKLSEDLTLALGIKFVISVVVCPSIGLDLVDSSVLLMVETSCVEEKLSLIWILEDEVSSEVDFNSRSIVVVSFALGSKLPVNFCSSCVVVSSSEI
jgi:hypothetical protein